MSSSKVQKKDQPRSDNWAEEMETNGDWMVTVATRTGSMTSAKIDRYF